MGLECPFVSADVEEFDPADEVENAEQTGEELGNHGGKCRAGHTHVSGQDEDEVEHDVDGGGDHEKDNRGPGVTERADCAGDEVVQEGGRDSEKDQENVLVGVAVDVRRCVHRVQNPRAEEADGRRHDYGEQRAEIDAVNKEAAHFCIFAGAKLLGEGNGKTIADAHAESDDHEIDGAGGTHTGERFHAEKAADDEGVHHVVELLKKQSAEKRHGKAEDEFHGIAGREVFHSAAGGRGGSWIGNLRSGTGLVVSGAGKRVFCHDDFSRGKVPCIVLCSFCRIVLLRY